MTDEEQMSLERFKSIYPPEFSRGESEDAQVFIDQCRRILCTTGIVDTIGVSYTIFQLTRSTYRLWQTYEPGMSAGAALFKWHEFLILFLEKFVPKTLIEELHR